MKRKQTRLEFRLLILPSYKEVSRRHETVFRLETLKEFSSFNYEIVVDEKLEGRKILWNIQGLRSPIVTLPNYGAATFSKTYENLRGRYEFVITKLDGVENVFTLNISEQKIRVIKAPRQRFIEIGPSVSKSGPLAHHTEN